jgi:hypothetical protein
MKLADDLVVWTYKWGINCIEAFLQGAFGPKGEQSLGIERGGEGHFAWRAGTMPVSFLAFFGSDEDELLF